MTTINGIKSKVKEFFSDKRKRLAVILSGAGVLTAAVVAVVVLTLPATEVIAGEDNTRESTSSSTSRVSDSDSSSSGTFSSGVASSESTADEKDTAADSSSGTDSSEGASGAPGSLTSGSTGTSSGDSSSSTPSHSHSFSIPVYGTQPWIVTVSAQPAVAEQGYWQGYYSVGGVKYYSWAEAQAAMERTGIRNHSSGEDWVITAPAQPAVSEQGYYGEAPLTGYRCSCGVTQ